MAPAADSLQGSTTDRNLEKIPKKISQGRRRLRLLSPHRLQATNQDNIRRGGGQGTSQEADRPCSLLIFIITLITSFTTVSVPSSREFWGNLGIPRSDRVSNSVPRPCPRTHPSLPPTPNRTRIDGFPSVPPLTGFILWFLISARAVYPDQPNQIWWKAAQFITIWRGNKLTLRYLILICYRQEMEGICGAAASGLKPKKEVYFLRKLLQFNIPMADGRRYSQSPSHYASHIKKSPSMIKRISVRTDHHRVYQH